jgi:hypothetical protein
MQYKTILLEMIRQDQDLHGRLKRAGTLASTLDRLARELKERHEAWADRLARTRPGLDPGQARAEALELAVAETDFGSMPADAEAEPLSLDAAMDFLRRATPPE